MDIAKTPIVIRRPAFESFDAAPPASVRPAQELPKPVPIISETKRKENFEKVRAGFLHQDKEGRSVAGGVCNEAFQELINECGDPHSWTAENMQRPAIQDVTLTYHTLALLRDRRSALTPDEQQVLKRLIERQEKINKIKIQAISQQVNLANLPESTRQTDNLATNQRVYDNGSG